MTAPGDEEQRLAEQRYFQGRQPPPLPVRQLGRIGSRLIVSAPRLWPLLRWANTATWDRLAGRWDERIRPDSPDHLAPLDAAFEHIEAPPLQILELGTGTGAGAIALARRFTDAAVLGVDVSEAMVSAAAAKRPDELAGRLEFAVADAASLPYKDGTFDLVAQLNMPPFLDQVVRVLAPGGYVLVADSLGANTPSHVPERLLRNGFERRGVGVVASSRAGAGTFLVARKRH
jgi:SAM-dependent methyltransferase